MPDEPATDNSLCAACGERTPATDPDPCPHCGGEQLLAGRFRLLRVLGEGATGTTYLARDDAGSPLAIKETLLRASDAAKARELLEREAQVLRQLDHPQIPSYVDHGLAGTGKSRFFWLAQTFVDGQDLGTELTTTRFDEQGVRDILRELCDVLAYLHRLSPPVIHRDLKPGNVMRRADGSLVLIDFGSVRDALKGADLGGSTVAGTFGYMAPEQFLGEATPQTDMYGLGALAVALLSRKDPSRMLGPDRTVSWRGHCQPSPALGRILDRLLAEDPAQRPSSAAEVARLLGAPADSAGPGSPSTRTAPSTAAAPRRSEAVGTTFAEPVPADAPEPFHQPPAVPPGAAPGRDTSRDREVVSSLRAVLALFLLGALLIGGSVALVGYSVSPAVAPPRVEAPARPPPAPVPPALVNRVAPWPMLTAEQLRTLPETVRCPGESCVSPFAEVAEQLGKPRAWERSELPPLRLLLPHSSTATLAPGPDDPGPLLDTQETRPQSTDHPAPSFPSEAKSHPLAEVMCQVVASVDSDGTPYHLAVDGCPAAYHKGTIDALRKWSWEVSQPARIPVPVRYRMRWEE
ncbi:MAG: hypothetical protein ACI8PZ_006051 [Myxococcota bacterium]|jgi:hypothetical protein